ncbi:sugar transferase [bacterium]|nr:MAG: sugar transferase [bacterium]
MTDETKAAPRLIEAGANPLPRSRYGQPGYMLAKRCFDVVFAAVGLIVLFPVFLIVGLLIAAKDGFPVIYRHRRVGRNNEPIYVLKFRSMVKNADEVLKKDPELYAEFLKSFKLENDPRITKIGSFIRKTSLDELPQLLNVIAGDMSLVGPRPIVPDELERYGDRQDVYLAMIPGCAGLWQCSGRSETSYEERVQLDVDYYGSASFWTDLKILGSTMVAICRRDGAK